MGRSSEQSGGMGVDGADGAQRSRPETPNAMQGEQNIPCVETLLGSLRSSEEDPAQALNRPKLEVAHVNNMQDWLGSQIPERELRERRGPLAWGS